MTLDLPGDLLKEARRAARVRTTKEAVIAGLQELIRKSHLEELRRLAGRVDLQIDIARSRDRKRS